VDEWTVVFARVNEWTAAFAWVGEWMAASSHGEGVRFVIDTCQPASYGLGPEKKQGLQFLLLDFSLFTNWLASCMKSGLRRYILVP